MPSENWRRHWVAEKCKVAERLSRGEAGGGYAEAAILVCATLSALAAELWDGTGIDRVRFIEMLVRLGPEAGTCGTISVPLLTQHLEASGREAYAKQLQRAFSVPSIARVLTGPEVDRAESEILAVCPGVDLEEVRRFSYASILYGEVRSSYAHDYRPGELADSWPMTMLQDQKVSYINRLCEDLQTRRLVHFHLEWLTALPVELAGVVDSLAVALPQTRPTAWWAKGG
jgi:hypothetical protein